MLVPAIPVKFALATSEYKTRFSYVILHGCLHFAMNYSICYAYKLLIFKLTSFVLSRSTQPVTQGLKWLQEYKQERETGEFIKLLRK